MDRDRTAKRWKIAITAISAVLLIAHLIWPSIKLDAAAIFLIALCFLPWLGAIFKSIELPGGTKVEYREQVLKAVQKLEDSGLIPTDQINPEDPIYLGFVNRDPNLALAGLRLDIERKLRTIADLLQLPEPHTSLRHIVDGIGEKGLFTPNQTQAMHDILRTLNNAVHGGKIAGNDARDVLIKGIRLLDSLDKRIAKQRSKLSAT